MTPPEESRIDPELVDALGSLGNRNRLEILLALADAGRKQQRQWNTMSFTELYEAVEIDSSSQFAYHLDQLVDHFVAETADGYRLTYGGDKIVRAVLSGVYESTPRFEGVDTDGVCVFCDEASLVATLDEEWFVVRCTSCESRLLIDSFPRSQAHDRTPSEIVESFGYRIWSAYVLVRGYVCPECYGQVETDIETHELDSRVVSTLTSTCQSCWFVIHMPIEAAAALHPAAIGFLWKHGISLLDLPLWEFFEYISSDVVTTELESVDPPSAEFEFTLSGETLRLSMDDELTMTPN